MNSFNSFKNTVFFLGGFFLFFGHSICAQILPGAQDTSAYLPLLKGKKVGVVAHAASQIYHGNSATHLIDSLLSHKINLIKIFAPEHGFRSREDNGAIIKDEIDASTQLPIISLHGKNRKPQAAHLKNIDLMVFDLQDVGVRFYTYLSTLHLVMEACAENSIPLIILDRPNPNGHYVDGPIMEEEYKGFLGMHSIPIVHGLTLGEFAQMINGERWLKDGKHCATTVIKNKNYTHSSAYDLPVRPSPNLPNSKAINLYPSLCLFEQTPISIGRGTEKQFQIYGHPDLTGEFSFTPQPNFGAKYPKLAGKICHGENLQHTPRLNQLSLKWLISAYREYPEKSNFFSKRFVVLAGTKKLEQQIQAGWSEEEIRKSWSSDLYQFNTIREKYLLYPN